MTVGKREKKNTREGKIERKKNTTTAAERTIIIQLSRGIPITTQK